jgi:hypothetical protein
LPEAGETVPDDADMPVDEGEDLPEQDGPTAVDEAFEDFATDDPPSDE